MPVKSATIDIRISKFRPIGAVLTSAVFKLGAHDPRYFQINGKNITIIVYRGVPNEVELIFRTTSPRYVLLGIAFTEVAFKARHVGVLEFPQVVISAPGKSPPITRRRQMSVRDAHVLSRMGINYDYYIFIQDAVTGLVGVIDPPLDTEVED